MRELVAEWLTEKEAGRRQNYTRMDFEKLQGAIRILTCGISFTQPQHDFHAQVHNIMLQTLACNQYK